MRRREVARGGAVGVATVTDHAAEDKGFPSYWLDVVGRRHQYVEADVSIGMTWGVGVKYITVID